MFIWKVHLMMLSSNNHFSNAVSKCSSFKLHFRSIRYTLQRLAKDTTCLKRFYRFIRDLPIYYSSNIRILFANRGWSRNQYHIIHRGRISSLSIKFIFHPVGETLKETSVGEWCWIKLNHIYLGSFETWEMLASCYNYKYPSVSDVVVHCLLI